MSLIEPGQHECRERVNQQFENHANSLGFSCRVTSNALVVPQPLPANNLQQRPTTNTASSTSSSQPAFRPPSFGESPAQTMNNPMGSHQGFHQFLPLPDASDFYSYDGSLNTLGSGADSNSSFQIFDGSDLYTTNTTVSGYDMAANDQREYGDRTGTQLPSSQPTTSSVPQPLTYAHRNRDISYAHIPSPLVGHDNTIPSYAGPSVPSGTQQQQGATLPGFRQNSTAQITEPLPSRSNDEQDFVGAPAWAEYDRGFAS